MKDTIRASFEKYAEENLSPITGNSGEYYGDSVDPYEIWKAAWQARQGDDKANAKEDDPETTFDPNCKRVITLPAIFLPGQTFTILNKGEGVEIRGPSINYYDEYQKLLVTLKIAMDVLRDIKLRAESGMRACVEGQRPFSQMGDIHTMAETAISQNQQEKK